MNTSYRPKTMTDTYNHRSYFDWGSNMQVVRKGEGEIAMTEGELVRFFGVSWRKLNYRLQTIIKFSNLYPDERDAGQEELINGREWGGYASLYPLSTIIAMSFQLDSIEAHLFRKYLCEKLQKPASVITPIFLLGNTNN